MIPLVRETEGREGTWPTARDTVRETVPDAQAQSPRTALRKPSQMVMDGSTGRTQAKPGLIAHCRQGLPITYCMQACRRASWRAHAQTRRAACCLVGASVGRRLAGGEKEHGENGWIDGGVDGVEDEVEGRSGSA